MLIQIDFRYGVQDPKKISNIIVVVTNGLQIVWSNTKNRNGNETIILEMYTVLCEKYTVSSFMHLLSTIHVH